MISAFILVTRQPCRRRSPSPSISPHIFAYLSFDSFIASKRGKNFYDPFIPPVFRHILRIQQTSGPTVWRSSFS